MPRVAEILQCVIVADYQMVRDLLAAAVNGLPGIEVIATAAHVAESEWLAALGRVDLLIVDRQLKTGDGMGVVRVVAARHPEVRCIVIAGSTSDFICPPDLLDVVVSVVDKSSACGFLLDEIVRVVQLPRGPETAPLSAGGTRSLLTARQWELFVALGEGLSNKELAKTFGLSPRTIETHRKAIAKKLGVSGAALVRMAVLQHRMSGHAHREGNGAGAVFRAGGDGT